MYDNGDGAAGLVLHRRAPESDFEVIDMATPLSVFAGHPKWRAPSRSHLCSTRGLTMSARTKLSPATVGPPDATIVSSPPRASAYRPSRTSEIYRFGPDGLQDAGGTHLPALADMAHGADSAETSSDPDLVATTLSPVFRKVAGDRPITPRLDPGDPDRIAGGPDLDRVCALSAQIVADIDNDGRAERFSCQLTGNRGHGPGCTRGATVNLHQSALRQDIRTGRNACITKAAAPTLFTNIAAKRKAAP